MRIALTGSTGFIGAGVLRHLSVDHEVIRIGRRPECDMRVDLADERAVARMDLTGCEVLIHCAGVVDADFITEPQKAWNQAVAGAEALILRALAGGVKRLIYFSTTHVYGVFQGVISEERMPCPLTPYAQAHYATEQLFRKYARTGVGVYIVRPNAAYGVPVDWDTFDRWELVPFDLPLQAVYNNKIVLKTSGEQKRNFISLEDLVAYVEQMLTDPLADEVFLLNAVGSETLRVVDFAKLCARVFFDLTGRPCGLDRPSGETQASNDFQLITCNRNFKPSREVSEFLRSFIGQAMDRFEKGLVYRGR